VPRAVVDSGQVYILTNGTAIVDLDVLLYRHDLSGHELD
jgi:hypothetical protein